MNNEFKILISSDLEYEELCAEIYFQDEFVAMLTQENGIENFEIQIHPPKNAAFWIFKFSEFELALQSAKLTLLNMRKI